MIPAEKIMTKDVVTISENTGVLEVVRLLVKHRISGLPVVDSDRHLVGVISEKDVLELLINSDKDGATVADYMTRSVTSFKETDEVADICRFFIKSSVRRVPILNERQELVGLISRRDIINEIQRIKGL